MVGGGYLKCGAAWPTSKAEPVGAEESEDEPAKDVAMGDEGDVVVEEVFGSARHHTN